MRAAILFASLGLVLASSAAGARSGLAETVVRFAFHASSPTYVVTGNGKMSFFKPLVEGAEQQAHPGYNHSTITIRRGGLSATFAVRPTGYRYEYSYGSNSALVERVVLGGDVTRSTLRAFPVGTVGQITLSVDPVDPLLNYVSARVGTALEFRRLTRVGASVSIVATPKPTPLPSELTLTVGTTKAVATTRAPSQHETAGQVVPNASIEIEATLNHPLPPGWKMTVWHNGDPESKGNGDYYKLCDLTGSATNKEPPRCSETRKTLPAAGDDFVSAGVYSLTATALYIQIQVPVR